MSNKKAKGKRAKTRTLLRKKNREKTTVNDIIKPIEKGDIVQIKINSSIHEGFPPRRTYGKSGEVIAFQGKLPVVLIKDGNMLKKIICHNVHLKKIKQISKKVEKNE
jgi:large subunit ribosomal protein L21e